MLSLPALALLLVTGCAANRQGPSETEQARRLLETPLAQTVGAEPAVRIRAMAEANGMLAHCQLRWQGYFGRMMTQQRDEGRTDDELRRIALWHGYWQGQTQRAAGRDGIACPSELLLDLRERAEALLRPAP